MVTIFVILKRCKQNKMKKNCGSKCKNDNEKLMKFPVGNGFELQFSCSLTCRHVRNFNPSFATFQRNPYKGQYTCILSIIDNLFKSNAANTHIYSISAHNAIASLSLTLPLCVFIVFECVSVCKLAFTSMFYNSIFSIFHVTCSMFIVHFALCFYHRNETKPHRRHLRLNTITFRWQ